MLSSIRIPVMIIASGRIGWRRGANRVCIPYITVFPEIIIRPIPHVIPYAVQPKRPAAGGTIICGLMSFVFRIMEVPVKPRTFALVFGKHRCVCTPGHERQCHDHPSRRRCKQPQGRRKDEADNP